MSKLKSKNLPAVNWRADIQATDFDPDDELIVPTPPDVVQALGFDPADEDERDEASMLADAVTDALVLATTPGTLRTVRIEHEHRVLATDNASGESADEFGSAEKARQLHELLSDFKKNGVARSSHLEKLDRVEKYLGIGKHAQQEPQEPGADESMARTQSAIDAFHRLMIAPHLREEPQGKVGEARHKNKLLDLRSYHQTAKGIAQDKSLAFKEREARVKGLLWHGMNAYPAKTTSTVKATSIGGGLKQLAWHMIGHKALAKHPLFSNHTEALSRLLDDNGYGQEWKALGNSRNAITVSKHTALDDRQGNKEAAHFHEIAGRHLPDGMEDLGAFHRAMSAYHTAAANGEGVADLNIDVPDAHSREDASSAHGKLRDQHMAAGNGADAAYHGVMAAHHLAVHQAQSQDEPVNQD